MIRTHHVVSGNVIQVQFSKITTEISVGIVWLLGPSDIFYQINSKFYAVEN